MDRMSQACICDTVQLNRPSMADPYQPDDQKVRHPLCPYHGWSEGDPWHDWDFSADFYDLALTYSGEWIDADEWDDETGERKTA